MKWLTLTAAKVSTAENNRNRSTLTDNVITVFLLSIDTFVFSDGNQISSLLFCRVPLALAYILTHTHTHPPAYPHSLPPSLLSLSLSHTHTLILWTESCLNASCTTLTEISQVNPGTVLMAIGCGKRILRGAQGKWTWLNQWMFSPLCWEGGTQAGSYLRTVGSWSQPAWGRRVNSATRAGAENECCTCGLGPHTWC